MIKEIEDLSKWRDMHVHGLESKLFIRCQFFPISIL